jgi:DNA polymerase-4
VNEAPRLIAHVDMDAFFASVELLRYPQLASEPVVVGGRRRGGASGGAGGVGADSGRDPDPGTPLGGFERLHDYRGRGVVTTATYAARAFGIHSGMALMQAARLCPQALLLPADFERYRHYSKLFKAAIRELAPRVEDRGIDEVFVDLAAAPGGMDEGGKALALRIQRSIREATGLSCSIGIAPNKLLAKIASDLEKPGGLTLVGADDLATRIWPLPCRRINGVGPKAAQRLESLGVRTIGELAQRERAWLVGHFGRHHGGWLHEVAWGRDERRIVTESEPVSMSCETTFERDLHAVRDRAELAGIFTSLCSRLAADLARHGYAGRTVAVKLRYEDFRSVTRARTVDHHVADAREIRRIAAQCIRRAPLDRPLRLLGVRVASLVPAARAQRAPPAPPDSLQLF